MERGEKETWIPTYDGMVLQGFQKGVNRILRSVALKQDRVSTVKHEMATSA
jgi:hypothetical protein